MPEKTYLTVVEVTPEQAAQPSVAGTVAAQAWFERAALLNYEPIVGNDGIAHLRMNGITQEDKHYVKVAGTVRHD